MQLEIKRTSLKQKNLFYLCKNFNQEFDENHFTFIFCDELIILYLYQVDFIIVIQD